MPFPSLHASRVAGLLLLGTTAAAHAQTDLYWSVFQHHYAQTTATSHESGVAYRFANWVQVADAATIAPPTITIPAGPFAGTSNDWIRNYDFYNQGTFDDAFSPGDYTYAIGGASATLTIGAAAYPDALAITGGTWDNEKLRFNNGVAQTIAFSGPTAGNFNAGVDYLTLTLREQSIGTTFIFSSFDLVNGFDIPVGSLVDGASDDLELQWINTSELDTTSIAGATGLAGYGTHLFAELTVTHESAVPEPATWGALFGLGALRVAASRRRRGMTQATRPPAQAGAATPRRSALCRTISPRSAAGRISHGPNVTPGCCEISSTAWLRSRASRMRMPPSCSLVSANGPSVATTRPLV